MSCSPQFIVTIAPSAQDILVSSFSLSPRFLNIRRRKNVRPSPRRPIGTKMRASRCLCTLLVIAFASLISGRKLHETVDTAPIHSGRRLRGSSPTAEASVGGIDIRNLSAADDVDNAYPTSTSPTPIPGNDTDSHGCKASTGEMWCALTQSCYYPGKEYCPVVDIISPSIVESGTQSASPLTSAAPTQPIASEIDPRSRRLQESNTDIEVTLTPLEVTPTLTTSPVDTTTPPTTVGATTTDPDDGASQVTPASAGKCPGATTGRADGGWSPADLTNDGMFAAVRFIAHALGKQVSNYEVVVSCMQPVNGINYYAKIDFYEIDSYTGTATAVVYSPSGTGSDFKISRLTYTQ